MARIIAVGGPPHSGKSVLIRSLAKTGASIYVVPEAPDGEGPGWSALADREVVRALRQKGDFSDPKLWEALATWAATLVENADKISAQVAMLDLGGKITPENRAILQAVGEDGGLIILARSDRLETIPEWEALAAEAGVPVVAILNSDLHGESRVEVYEAGRFRATVAGLVRGDEDQLAQDLTIRAIARYLVPDEGQVVGAGWWDPVAARLGVETLGRALGLEVREGRTWWEPSVLLALWHTLARLKWPGQVLVGDWGPNFAYVTTCHALHPSRLWVEDPKVTGGRVCIPRLKVSDEAVAWEHPVTWEITEGSDPGEDLVYQVYGMRIPGYLLDANKLTSVQVPEPAPGKGVVLEGRAPLWLYVSVAEALAHRVPWVGVAQPHLWQGQPGFTVAVTHAPYVPLGGVYRLTLNGEKTN